MNNKIKKIISFTLILTIFILFTKQKVDAKTIYEGKWIPNIYLKLELNGSQKYMQAEFFRRRSDNSYVYCLEPFIKIKNNSTYEEVTSNYHKRLALPEKRWERILLLAYYGYKYQNHQEDKWYVITQVLIWRTMSINYQVSFTDKLNGNILPNAYQEEINELENLVKKHSLLPSFNDKTLSTSYHNTLTLEDENASLKDYHIGKSTLPATITNNNLTIEATTLGNHQIILEKQDTLYKNVPVLYLSEDSQNVLLPGSYEPQSVTLNINVVGPSLKIVKKDLETKETLKVANIKFKVKDLKTNEYLINKNNPDEPHIFKTNQDGKILIDNLNFGKYIITEENTIPGYLKNTQEKLVELTKDTTYPKENNKLIYEVPIYNERLTTSLKVIKLGESTTSKDRYIPLNNITIGLYAKENIKDINGKIIHPKNSLIAMSKTNQDGIIEFTSLYLGKYYLKEITTQDNYLLDTKEYAIDLSNINSKDEIKSLKLINYLKKGSVSLVKKDSLTKEVLPGVKINLYKDDNTIIYEGITNTSGLLSIDNLPLGTYYFEEIEAIPGYTTNQEKLYFTLKDHNESLELTFLNDPIIPIPDTYSHKKDWSKIIEGALIITWLIIIFRRKAII